MRHGPSLGPPLVILFHQALSQTKTNTEKKDRDRDTDKKEDRNKEEGDTVLS